MDTAVRPALARRANPVDAAGDIDALLARRRSRAPDRPSLMSGLSGDREADPTRGRSFPVVRFFTLSVDYLTFVKVPDASI
jgi:hypothetical protein